MSQMSPITVHQLYQDNVRCTANTSAYLQIIMNLILGLSFENTRIYEQFIECEM